MDIRALRNRRFHDRLRAFIAARLDSRSHLGRHLTVAVIVAALACWLFGAMMDAVMDNATVVRFDLAAAAWIHHHVTRAGLIVFVAITTIGSPISRTAIAVLGAAALARRRYWTILAGWLTAFIGGEIIQRVLKYEVGRTRPENGTQYLHEASYSFPSGHSMGSAIAFSMAAYVLLLFWRGPRRWRRFVVFIAAALIIAVAVSRVYLGVHYPSDVVGGVAAGAGWAAVCISATRIALHRDRISLVD
jgi:membrane-associated phospholipid phosphatase